MAMRILVGGLHTECSTYSPLQQTAADFFIAAGQTLVERLAPVTPPGVELVGLFHARSVPGGPLCAETYRAFKRRLLDEMAGALPADGIYMPLHGAMHAIGMDDAEGDLLTAMRDLVGPKMPIAVSYDLHGNVTQAVIDAIDIFAAYRTAPHVDVMETQRRALALLVDTLATGTRRMVGWVPVPVLMPGERTSTAVEPTRSLYAALPGHSARSGVCDANLMVGYVWADTPRATAAAVVTGTDRAAIAQSAEQIARAYWEARAAFDFCMPTAGLKQAVAQAAAATTLPFILADSGDNPTGGGVGDRADVLAALIRHNVSGAVIAGIADAPAALAAARVGQARSCSLMIGGSLGSPCPRVEAEVIVERIVGDAADGDIEALVAIDGLRVVLTQRRRPYHTLADFWRLGLVPAEIAILVVKSGYLSPDLSPIANPPLMALTDGAVNQDIEALTNVHRPRPSYPFDTEFEFSPMVHWSQRD